MGLEGKEKGLRTPYAVRYGISPPSYLGVSKQKPAHMLTDAHGVDGLNIRILGGRPCSRPGQTKVNADAIEPIHGFHDSTGEVMAAAPLLPAVTVYFVGVDPDPFILEVDFAGGGTETLHRLGAIGGADPSYNIQFVNITPIVGTDGKIYLPGIRIRNSDNFQRNVVLQVPFLTWTVTEIDLSAFANLSGVSLSGMVEAPLTHAPDFFVIQSEGIDTPASVVISSYLSAAVTLEDTVSSAPANSGVSGAIFAFNGTVYTESLLTDGVTGLKTDKLRKRTSLSTWADVPMPTSPVSHSGFSCGQNTVIVYRGYCYLFGEYPGGSPTVLRLDPTDVVTSVHIGGADGYASSAIHRGILYFITDGGNLGSFDGSTWTEDIFTGFGSSLTATSIRSDGVNLWATLYKPADNKSRIWKSDGADVTSWTLMHTGTAGLILDAMVTPL